MHQIGAGHDALASELRRLSHRNSLEDAVTSLGLWSGALSPMATLRSTEWVRGGAETYVMTFAIEDGAKIETFLIKACVPTALGRPLEAVLADWVRRRELLAAAGVAVPRLYYSGEGVLIEEYIPFLLLDRLRNVELILAFELGRTFGVLRRLGFNPINLMGDLRSRGHDVVVVDFGEDLGDPRQQNSEGRVTLKHLTKEISGAGLVMNDEAKIAVERGYETALATSLPLSRHVDASA